LHPDKCEFLRREVSYLGQTGIKSDEKRIRAAKDCPKPRTTRELRFLGLVGYCKRFIPDFSKIAKPLTGLLKKCTPYIWNDKTEATFVTLKTVLTTDQGSNFMSEVFANVCRLLKIKRI
jgi:hypothetical protein